MNILRRFIRSNYRSWLFPSILFALLLTFLIYPLFTILQKSVLSDQGLSFTYYASFFSESRYYTAIFNTFAVAIPVTLISTVLGFVFAYYTTRLNIPGANIFRIIAMFPLILPPFLVAFSVTLFGGRNGILTNLFNLPGEIYGWPGLVIAQSICFIPYVYITLQASVRSLDPTLEEASRDLGADEFKTFKDVTISLLLPSILNAAFLVLILSMADFGTPLLIGGRFKVLSIMVYHNMMGGAARPHMAAVTGIVLLVPTLVFFAIKERLFAGKSYVTITGRTTTALVRQAGGWLRWVMAITLMGISLIILAIVGMVIFMSFVNIPLLDYTFTITHYPDLLRQPYVPILILFRNTLLVSTFAPMICLMVAFGVAYFAVRRASTISRTLDFISAMPFAIPGTVFGIGYIFSFSTGLLTMTGTIYILIINVAFHNLPVSVAAGKNRLMQISDEIEEVARDLGASKMRMFKDILLPLWKPAILGGGLYTFITGLKTISAVIFLVSPAWNLIVVEILDLLNELYLGLGCALCVILIVMASITQYLIQRFGEEGIAL